MNLPTMKLVEEALKQRISDSFVASTDDRWVKEDLIVEIDGDMVESYDGYIDELCAVVWANIPIAWSDRPRETMTSSVFGGATPGWVCVRARMVVAVRGSSSIVWVKSLKINGDERLADETTLGRAIDRARD